ncbi:MAG: rhodanese-like domain-containing protein [Bacteroidota bacterium]
MHRAVTILCVMVLTFGVYGIAKGFQGKAGRDMSPVEAEKALKGDSTLVVLDVRTSDEFGSETGHLRGARLIPVQELDKRMGELDPVKARTIIVYCRTGHRSKIAQNMLLAKGFNAINVTGGIVQWNAKHLPVVKEPREQKK